MTAFSGGAYLAAMGSPLVFQAHAAPLDRSRAPKSTRLALLNFADDFALGTRSIAAHVRSHGYACDLVFVKRLPHNSADYAL